MTLNNIFKGKKQIIIIFLKKYFYLWYSAVQIGDKNWLSGFRIMAFVKSIGQNYEFPLFSKIKGK